jgi:hypothetical protein
LNLGDGLPIFFLRDFGNFPGFGDALDLRDCSLGGGFFV